MYLNGYTIAYRLEDVQGQSKDFINGRPVIIPDGYFLGNTNPCIYKEPEYMSVWPRYDLYEYLLYPSALTYPRGEVLFRQDDIISKVKIRT